MPILETWKIRMIECPRLHTQTNTELCMGMCPKFKSIYCDGVGKVTIDCRFGEED